jgi:hypothetical protein
VAVTTSPSGLGTSVTYDGSSTAPTNAGPYAIVATVSDPNYTGSTSGTLVVARASQTISFDPLPDKYYGDPDFTVSATTSSGLTIGFSAAGNCSISGSTVTVPLIGVGPSTCTITASQAGNTNYNAAVDVSQQFTIDNAPPGP